MNWKETYTKIFLKELNKTCNNAAVQEHIPIWWMNTRNKEKNGLRLTEEGRDILNELNIVTYEIPYPKEMPVTAQVIIYLDKFIDCPYYFTNKSITVTNERKAVELTLFSGDVRKYGYTKAMSRANKTD
jgi:hypothetical protein